jgi:signal transduction histidine kinase
LAQIFKFADGNESEKEFVVSKIQQEIQVLDGVISDLNIILKVKNGIENNVERISLKERLEAVLEGIKEEITETGAVIRYDFSKAEEGSFIQPYLHSIFYMLISNAIKYRSPERKPEIVIETSVIENDIICIRVKDNGLGMDLHRVGNKIFGFRKTFHTTINSKGIGLFMTRAHVESLGGEISVESEVNKGTTFTVFFEKNVPKQPIVKAVNLSEKTGLAQRFPSDVN